MKFDVLCAVFVCMLVAAECGGKANGHGKKASKSRGRKSTIITDCTESVNKDMEGFLDYFNARDFKKLATYYHRDFYYITPRTPSLLSRTQFLNYYKYVLLRNPRIMIKFSISEVFCLDERSAVGTCIFQLNYRPGQFGRALMVWVKDNKGVWKLFKEAVDTEDNPQTLPELLYHWNKNGLVNTFTDDETEQIDDIDSPADPFYKVKGGQLVDA